MICPGVVVALSVALSAARAFKVDTAAKTATRENAIRL